MNKGKKLLIALIAVLLLTVSAGFIWIGVHSTEAAKKKETIQLMKTVFDFDMEAHSFDYTWENTLNRTKNGGTADVTFCAPEEEAEKLFQKYQNSWIQDTEQDEMMLKVLERMVSMSVDVPNDEVRDGKTAKAGTGPRRTFPLLIQIFEYIGNGFEYVSSSSGQHFIHIQKLDDKMVKVYLRYSEGSKKKDSSSETENNPEAETMKKTAEQQETETRTMKQPAEQQETETEIVGK